MMINIDIYIVYIYIYIFIIKKYRRNIKIHCCIHSLVSASNDVFTASDNSIGNSGGTTDVKIKVHSKNSLYLLRVSSFVPKTINKSQLTTMNVNN